jgi:hypothetical protein
MNDLLNELVSKSRIKADITVLHPAADQELTLGIEYERFQKKRQRQQRWLSPFRNMIRFTGREDEPGQNREDEPEQIQQDVSEEFIARTDPEEDEDDAIKERLSEQIQDRDVFIINKHINDIIVENSKHADLVMLGFNIPDKGREKKYIEKMEALLEKLPDTILINCPFDFDLYE